VIDPRKSSPAECPVLIVDDEPDMTSVYRSVLEDDGYPVRTAASREEALEILKTFRAALIFLDCRMTGMSLQEFKAALGELQKNEPASRVVGFSSFSPHSAFATEMRELFGDFVEKPHDLDQFLQAIKSRCQG